jgi:hypothetical protein
MIFNSEARPSMNWRKALLLGATVPVSFIMALACEGLWFRHSLPTPTPGLMVWALFHPPGSSRDFDFSFVGVSLLIDTVCLVVVQIGAYALVRALRRGQS